MADPKLEPLEQLWNEHMFTGTEGHYSDGKESAYRGKGGYESAGGAVAAADVTNRGIGVSDKSSSRFLGLFLGVGWSLRGGLLARASVNADFLELYGRLVARWSGGFLGLDTYAKHEDMRYEFFLLYRPVGAPRATVLREFPIPPEDIYWTPAGHEVVRGFMTYYPATSTAVVKITGLREEHEYTVDIGSLAAKP
jgi:hypothetical protein